MYLKSYFKIPVLLFAVGVVKSYIFNYITVRKQALFYRGGDIISVKPLVNGEHEPQIQHLIRMYSRLWNKNCFLIDIGANIGLISCGVGNFFKKVIMYEPNPVCAKVLEANAMLALTTEYEIHKYALADGDSMAKLIAPKHNFGGAFVMSNDNQYSLEQLAHKDGFNSYENSNYLEFDIEMRDSDLALSNIFSKLKNDGILQGVVKIDVEGYEKFIISSLARVLPDDFSLIIIFENLAKNLSKKDFLIDFNILNLDNNVELFQVSRAPSGNASLMSKIMLSISKGSISYSLEKVDDLSSTSNDLVILFNCDVPDS